MAKKRTKLQVNSASKNEEREHGLLKRTVVLWDESLDPADNSDRAAKMGMHDGTLFGVVAEFDEETQKSFLADGFIRGAGVVGSRRANPDCWALRLTEPEGKGKASHVDVRLIVDDVNRDSERTNLSTMFIDQCATQNWAFCRDLFKIRSLGATNDHDELAFTPAGFLWAVKKTGGKLLDRACLGQNISKRAGEITDGILDAASWHTMHISAGSKALKPLPKPKPKPTARIPFSGGLPGGPGSTVVEDRPASTPGDTTSEDRAEEGGGCGDPSLSLGTLRGDMEWDFAGVLAHLVVKDRFPMTKGRILTGHMFIDEPFPTPPAKELDQEDDVSNQVIIPRVTNQGLWIVVFDDMWYGVPEWGGVPPDYPDQPTHDTPCPGNAGAFDTDDFPASGNDIGIYCALPLPENFQDEIQVSVNFLIPSIDFSGDIDLDLDYLVTGLGDRADPTSVTGTLVDTINSTSHPFAATGAFEEARVIFTIPAADVRGNGGGKVELALYRSGVDGQADTLQMAKWEYQFGIGC